MNHQQILKRAWHILWNYRAIWIFGILLALTTASGGGGGQSGWRSNYNDASGMPFSDQSGNFVQTLENFGQGLTQFIEGRVLPNLVLIVIGLVLIGLVLTVLFTMLRFTSEAALIRMVDHYEVTGEKVKVGQGFRWGWSRSAWRLFLIDLLIFVPVTLVVLVLFGCAALPVMLGVLAQDQPTAVGIVATIGMVFLVIFLAVIIYSLLGLALEPIRRVCVIEGKGVIDSIRSGWQLVRRNFWNIVLMWLILAGIQIALSLVLIPVVLVLLLAGGAAGGGLGAGLFFLVRALGSETAAWISAISLGLVLLITVVSLPMLFVEGLKASYVSSVWTLAYRQIRPTVSDIPAEGPAPAALDEPQPAAE